MIRCACAIAIIASSACGSSPRAGRATSPPASQAALDEAARLGADAARLHATGRFREAVAPAERSLALRERALGPVHADVGASLGALGAIHLDQAAYDQAEPLLVRALAIAEQARGARHADVARALGDLGSLYRLRGAYDRARPLLTRALAIAERARGPAHPDVARALHDLGALDRDEGAYDKAESMMGRALEIRERALGPVHRDVARSLSGLAELHRIRGAFDQAEPLLSRALAIAEQALGPLHPDVARNLSDLAVLYWLRGAYDRAGPLQARALEIRERALGPMHTDVARSLNNLAMVDQDRGDFGEAEPLYVRALAIAEQALGPSHPMVASILNNLATLYWQQGAYDRAEPLLARALAIAEGSFGPTHPDVGQCLINLGAMYQIRGDYQRAEAAFARAVAITESALGPMHEDVATALTNLAWVYRDQHLDDKAERAFARALEINAKALGPLHPRGAVNLSNLAALYRHQRAFAKAEPLALRALEVLERALDPMHPEVARGLHWVARLYWAKGTPQRAEPLVARAAEIREAQLRIELPRLSEPRKRALMTLLQEETDATVSLHAHARPRSEGALELAVTTTLRRKGRILDSLIDAETALREHLTPALRGQLEQLDRARSDLVATLYTPQDATDRAGVAAVRARIEALESGLGAASAEFRVQSASVTAAKIQAALPAGAVLVELARYRRFDPGERQQFFEDRYVAYVLARDRPLQWVALGTAASIDAQVDAALAALDGKAPAGAARTALARLGASVLAPIRARLGGASHVILAPDGKLNLVPFEALIDARGRHALESLLISYVTTGRDLLRLAAPPAAPRSAAVIVAGPDYGPASPPRPIAFPPLADALGEAADLQRYFPSPAVTGAHATKSALKDLTGPAMLHIATHGFYARDRGPRPMPTPGNPSRELFASSSLLPPPRPDDPADGLDRAGLAMAGANQGAAGIVTAREIAGFDWWGTELVVLSACETGIGAVPSGDGVYGLRRALVLAGAASQVVSLWGVDDSSTRALMRDYYAELARGTGRAEALRRAKLRLLRQPRYAHPHDWAAFIPVGDWRPLDARTIPKIPP